MEQGDLFADFPQPEPVAQPDRRGTVQERFLAFHAANSWVYASLERLAADLIGRGRQRIGIGMLYEVVRWQVARTTMDEASGFKLDNYYRSRFARMLLEKHPEWDGKIETRRLTTE